MLFILIFLIEAIIFGALFVLFVPMSASLLWLEIILGILAGIILSALIRGIIFLFIGATNKFCKPFNKFRVWYINYIMSMIIVLFRCKVNYSGLEKIDKNKGYLFISNHKSNIDFMFYFKGLKNDTSVLAKKEFETSYIAKYGHILNALYLDRSNDKEGVKTILEAIKLCKSGKSLLVYPEGTRTDSNTSKMLESHPGTYKIALKSKVDIVPITVINANKIMKNMPWHKTKIDFIVHDPISYDTFKDMQTNEIEEMVRNIINEPIKE